MSRRPGPPDPRSGSQFPNSANLPKLDPDHWHTLEPLLDRALDLPDSERAEWIAGLRVSSPDLAGELESLLSEDEAADRQGFLADIPNVSLVGMQLGAYTLEAPLGHGGMGTVWLARRTDGRFEGRAAVKILNLALLSPAGQERFRREGSTLARLTHPGIGRLLDAGVSPSGQPFLVLELVEGTPIDAYVASRGLAPAACVSLFLKVLDAVGHAHANLVVHRDLKPSNILVAQDGSPKLLDFGIAKLLSGGPEAAAQTIDGMRAFTPQFAAPEQLKGGTITTATDIFSLGVLLAMLLGGSIPRDGSVRLGLGDLDTVIARAMRHDPNERYQTVVEFADDLRRWMRYEPVKARPDSALYRFRKFLRRNATATAVSLLFVALIATYIVTVVRDRERVRQALAEATIATQKAQQVTDFAVGLFESDENAVAFPMGPAARELLARGAARARELAGQPTLQAQMLDVIARIYADQGEQAVARDVFTEALEIRRKALGDDHPDVATSLVNLGTLIGSVEPKADAIPLFRRAVEIRRRHFGNDDERTSDAVYLLAGALHMTGDHAAARPLFEEWIDRNLRAPGQASPERADRLESMANVALFSGRSADAERLARQAVEMERALFGDDHLRVATALGTLGAVLRHRGDRTVLDSILRRPIEILRSAYPEGSLDLANALRDYAYVLTFDSRWSEAEAIWRDAADMYLRFGRQNSLAWINARAHQAYAATRLGRSEEAIPVLREGIWRHEEARPLATPVLGRVKLFLALALIDRGETAEARTILLSIGDAFAEPGDAVGYYERTTREALARLGKGDSGIGSR